MYNIEQFLGCLVAELHDRLHGLVATVYILELDIDELLIIIISTNMVRRKKLKMELI